MQPLKRSLPWLFTALCRLVLSLSFLFSGFTKLDDPLGMYAKLAAYLAHFGRTPEPQAWWLIGLAVALGAVEFVLGVYVLAGIRRRLTSWAVLLFMLAMTAVTLWVWIYNPVPDCGCFGQALTLTGGQTLLKNLVLLSLAVVSWHRRHKVARLISERNQWLTSIYAIVYCVALASVSLRHLPPVDFTPWKVGANVRAALQGQPERPAEADLAAFYLYNPQTADDATEAVLSDTGTTFLLTLPHLAQADAGCADRINALLDECQDRGYTLLGVVPTEASDSDVEQWTDRSGAAYPLLRSETELLETMVRSNPGLIMLHDGRLAAKWGDNDLPQLRTAEGQTVEPSQLQGQGRATPLWRMLLWFFAPLLLVCLLDRLWVGSRWYARRRQNKKTIQTHKPTTIMRKKIVAGNWKMNKNLQEGVALAKELNEVLTADKPVCDVVICTPFIHLASVAGVIDSSIIGLGAENCADKEKGAYTGEVSAEMVKSTGAQYVILGHSERRAYYHETPEMLKEKIGLALQNGLKVIFCIGEVLEDREAGRQNEVVEAQLAGSLFSLSQEEFKNIILAYEPVWAIGTGKTATAEQAQDMHAFIRSVIAGKFGAEAAEQVSILYGGSCKPGNAREIFSKPDVDGGLIGGAALKAPDFKGIIDAWK